MGKKIPSESLTKIHESWRAKIWVKIKNNWWESNKHMPRMKITAYLTEKTAQKNEKYLSEGRNPLAYSYDCLLTLYQLINFQNEFTEKYFAVFDQSSRMIYWSRGICCSYFFRNFSSIISFMVWLQYSGQIKGRSTFLCLASSVNVRQK